MSINTRRGLALLLIVVALGAGIASGLGVFARGDGSTKTATSIRGESYEYVTNGVYALNAERVVAEGVGWDIFTLFVVVPGLFVAAWLVARGSLKGRLFALGLLAYTFYQYLMYAMTWALGPLFPLWIALYAASLAGILWLVANVSLSELARSVTPRFPARGMAVFSGLMGLALVGMWSQRIACGTRRRIRDRDAPGTDDDGRPSARSRSGSAAPRLHRVRRVGASSGGLPARVGRRGEGRHDVGRDSRDARLGVGRRRACRRVRVRYVRYCVRGDGVARVEDIHERD